MDVDYDTLYTHDTPLCNTMHHVVHCMQLLARACSLSGRVVDAVRNSMYMLCMLYHCMRYVIALHTYDIGDLYSHHIP
jgi:hypothetical protein